MGMLDGRVAIVTGASRGIGEGIARLLASEGAKVVCAARTLNEGDHRMLEGSLSSTVQKIKDAGGEAIGVATDVSREEDCRRLVQAARDAYGPADLLVNNAALTWYIPVKDFEVSKWMKSFTVNVHAPFMMSKFAIPGMIEKGRGTIINISSGAAIGPGRGPYGGKGNRYGGTLYGASKAALERFTQGLAQELESDNIAVMAVSPSQVVPTPGTVHHKLVSSLDDPNSEHPSIMPKAVLLLATLPIEKITGRVTYSQQILKEHGWIQEARGRGVTITGTGYSQI